MDNETDGFVPLMQEAQRRRLNRDQTLRRTLQEGTAIQRAGRWFVRQPDQGKQRAEREGVGAA